MIKTPALLAIGCAVALSGCATTATLDSQSDTALQQMSDKLAGASQLSFSATRKLDRQLLASPDIASTATINVQVARPDRAKAIVKARGDERHLYIGKDGSAIYSPKTGFYGLFDGHPTIEKTCEAASANLGVHIPMQDFVGANPYRDFTAGSNTITHVGVENVGGQACDHLRGTRDDLAWDLWISQSDNLPRRYIISVSSLQGSNHLQLDFKDWNLNPSISAGTFDFTPPKNARQIDFIIGTEGAEE